MLGNGKEKRTRNVSPMIQAGLEDPSMKKAPIHLVEEAFVIAKSAGLMSQLLPPNETVTFTLVLQARSLVMSVNSDGVYIRLTICVITLEIPGRRLGIRNVGIDRLDGVLGSADKGRASVDGRVTILPRAKCNRISLNGQR